MAQRLIEQCERSDLRDHLLEKAAATRGKYGPRIDSAAIIRIVEDPELVRYPTSISFDASPLESGEFAFAVPLGSHPREGFCLCLHPAFEARPELWPRLIAYHIPPINYGDIADAEDCETFGAALLNMDIESYHEILCEAADSVSLKANQGVES